MFLARLIGLYYIVLPIAMMAHKQATMDILRAMLHNAPLLFALGAFTVIGGLAMVLSHNVWSGGAVPVIVTLTGWIALIKGSLLLFLSPEQESSLFVDTIRLEQGFYFYLEATLLLGIYMIYAAKRRTG
jgi:hypothetical protein